MGFLKDLFGKEQRESSHSEMMRKIIELEGLFSGDILDNPKTVDVDVNGYKGMCYTRCEQYQENIGKKQAEMGQILKSNDGSITPEKEQFILQFVDEMLHCVRKAAKHFFGILDKGDGESDEVKRRLNEESYQYSVEMRERFREQIKDLKDKM